jgi:hypothetical protein
VLEFVERSVEPKSPNIEGFAGSVDAETEEEKELGRVCCPGWS